MTEKFDSATNKFVKVYQENEGTELKQVASKAIDWGTGLLNTATVCGFPISLVLDPIAAILKKKIQQEINDKKITSLLDDVDKLLADLQEVIEQNAYQIRSEEDGCVEVTERTKQYQEATLPYLRYIPSNFPAVVSGSQGSGKERVQIRLIDAVTGETFVGNTAFQPLPVDVRTVEWAQANYEKLSNEEQNVDKDVNGLFHEVKKELLELQEFLDKFLSRMSAARKCACAGAVGDTLQKLNHALGSISTKLSRFHKQFVMHFNKKIELLHERVEKLKQDMKQVQLSLSNLAESYKNAMDALSEKEKFIKELEQDMETLQAKLGQANEKQADAIKTKIDKLRRLILEGEKEIEEMKQANEMYEKCEKALTKLQRNEREELMKEWAALQKAKDELEKEKEKLTKMALNKLSKKDQKVLEDERSKLDRERKLFEREKADWIKNRRVSVPNPLLIDPKAVQGDQRPRRPSAPVRRGTSKESLKTVQGKWKSGGQIVESPQSVPSDSDDDDESAAAEYTVKSVSGLSKLGCGIPTFLVNQQQRKRLDEAAAQKRYAKDFKAIVAFHQLDMLRREEMHVKDLLKKDDAFEEQLKLHKQAMDKLRELHEEEMKEFRNMKRQELQDKDDERDRLHRQLSDSYQERLEAEMQALMEQEEKKRKLEQEAANSLLENEKQRKFLEGKKAGLVEAEEGIPSRKFFCMAKHKKDLSYLTAYQKRLVRESEEAALAKQRAELEARHKEAFDQFKKEWDKKLELLKDGQAQQLIMEHQKDLDELKRLHENELQDKHDAWYQEWRDSELVEEKEKVERETRERVMEEQEDIYQSQIRALQDQIKSMEEENIRTIEEEQANFAKRRDSMNTQIVDLETTIDGLQKELNRLKGIQEEQNSLQAQIADLESTIDDLKHDLENKIDKINELEDAQKFRELAYEVARIVNKVDPSKAPVNMYGLHGLSKEEKFDHISRVIKSYERLFQQDKYDVPLHGPTLCSDDCFCKK